MGVMGIYRVYFSGFADVEADNPEEAEKLYGDGMTIYEECGVEYAEGIEE